MENKTDKGILGGSCNRSGCQKPDSAFWYNHTTRMYYCSECAFQINKVNKIDALRIYGHDLCTYQPINDHGK